MTFVEIDEFEKFIKNLLLRFKLSKNWLLCLKGVAYLMKTIHVKEDLKRYPVMKI